MCVDTATLEILTEWESKREKDVLNLFVVHKPSNCFSQVVFICLSDVGNDVHAHTHNAA